MMQRIQYAKDRPIIMMPAANLSAEEKAKIDNLSFRIEELTADHVVYSLSQMFVKTLNTLLAMFGEFAGDELAVRLARTFGERLGYAQWSNFLKGKGVKRGTPELMAEYQNMVHSIRGPAHASALWAEFDDRKCVVRRKKCGTYEGHPPGTGQYENDRLEGVFDGYIKADPGLEKIEHVLPCPNCENCEMIFWYKPS